MDEAVKFLERYFPTPKQKYLGELGLLRMKELVTRMGNPQLQYPTIHVGGTSGKGSTATIVASILATRYKVGLHTSPHLVKINERIQIFDKFKIQNSKFKITSKKLKLRGEISEKDFITLVNEIKPTVEQMEMGKYGAPSYFEIVTAMAFVYFAQEKVDIAVVEVGMGGRFDATNVIHPLVAILTNVGLDHTEILGETIEEIANDKVGIIKPGMRVVSGVTQPSVVNIVEKACTRANVSLSLVGRDFDTVATSVTEEGSVFDLRNGKKYFDLKLSLLGDHQIDNAGLAIRTIEELSMVNGQWLIEEEDIRRGLRSAHIPGRLEIVQRNPTVILDGAHNPDKIRALVEAVSDIWGRKKVTAVVAIKKDKNAKQMLEMLLPICSKIFLTQYQGKMDQGEIVSYSPQALRKVLKLIDINKHYKAIINPQRALQHAIDSTDLQDIILVTGSLYLVGILKQKQYARSVRTRYSRGNV